MSFGSVLREIQASKVFVSVLKSVSFESDISLWSTSIELKFWACIEDIYLICFPKSQGFWSCWEWIVIILCSSLSLRWLQGSSKIFRFMKLNEPKIWEKVVDIVFYVSLEFQIDPRSYVCGIALQSCCDKSLFWEDIKAKFWSGANTTWEKLKEGVWRLGSANTLSRPLYKRVICNHVLNTIRNIIRNMYIYIKPMYNIEFHIILKTYIHMQGPSCSTLTLTLILET